MQKPVAVLFDIDGTLISTGGAGTRAWRWAFNELHGIPADIGQFSGAGMTDPEVARRTFVSVIGHDPSGRELAPLLAKYLSRLPHEVEVSEGYKVFEGVPRLLPRLCDGGILLGITTVRWRLRPRSSLHAGNSIITSASAAMDRILLFERN